MLLSAEGLKGNLLSRQAVALPVIACPNTVTG